MYYVVDIHTQFHGKIRLLSCIHGPFAANIALFTRWFNKPLKNTFAASISNSNFELKLREGGEDIPAANECSMSIASIFLKF